MFRSFIRPENQISARQLRRRIKSQIAKQINNNLLSTTHTLKTFNGSIQNYLVKNTDDALVNANNSNRENLKKSEPSVLNNITHVDNFNFNLNKIQTFSLKSSASDVLDQLFFKQQIASWAVNEHISHTSLKKLLSILKKHSCHSDLPSDPRTLLNTPRGTVLRNINFGQYWHYGLKKGLTNFLNNKRQIQSNIIELMINVDGLPISKSSGSQFWPILGSVIGFNEVFIIGIYHSYSKKPENSHEFLEYFVDEAKELVNNGFMINDVNYQCFIKLICADAPAKSFILNVKGHTGYSSCTKCWDEGKYIEKRICFSDKTGKKHTDDEFVRKTDDDYHLGTSSALEVIPKLGLVTNVPFDYLHLICLGNVKKLIHLWCCDSLKVRIQYRKIKVISDILEKKIRPYTPFEFQRKPRGLMHYRQWKGTEFRQLLLYHGPVVLKSTLSAELYEHFLTLHCSITILISKQFCFQNSHLNYAEQLLQHYVTTFKLLYGEHHISHNVHGLLHIVDDVKYFGPLDSFSSFRFENVMQKFKDLIRKDDKPLQQIARRIHEIENSDNNFQNEYFYRDDTIFKDVHTNGPIMKGCVSQFTTMTLSGMKFQINNKGNNCCGVKGKIILIENVCYNDEHRSHVIVGKEFLEKTSLYSTPCSSVYLGIYQVDKNKLSKRSFWPVNEISLKYFIFPISGCSTKFAVFPLLHIDQQERPKIQ